MIDESLTEVLEAAFAAFFEEVRGPMVGRVEAYDKGAGGKPPKADVQPLMQLRFDDEWRLPPKLQGVPVAWPGGITYRITWPLAVGDYVKLLPYGEDHGKWLASGTVGAAPTFDRRFSLADMVAEPSPPWTAAVPLPANAAADDGMVILAALLYLGGADAVKLVGLDGDPVNKAETFAAWMDSVTTVAQAGGGVVSPLPSTITQIGLLASSATAVKAK